MTLFSLLTYVLVAAIVLTLIVEFGFKARKNYVMSFAQNYVGTLFLFSGWVKAVDPLGTAYKMQDYFAEFEATFESTWFGFIAPIFPLLSQYVVAFSVIMIVFEIVLGLMLIIGHKPQFTSWAFLLLVVFFTVLTGFTYLTGHVPDGVNFFSFGDWGTYKDTNMKVTDCGCFGDFIKLEPKTSFLKDVFLLLPGFFFLFRQQDMHQLFGKNLRNILVSLTVIGLTYYCFTNYVWDIPKNDFRPFKKGRNIYEAKTVEEQALANVQITHYGITYKETGEYIKLPYNQYLKEFKKYPKEEFELEQIKSEPSIKKSKLTDFDITDLDGYPINEAILNNNTPVLFLVAYKLYGDGIPATKILKDTLFSYDTLMIDGLKEYEIKRNIESISERTINYTDYVWKEDYADRYRNVIKPFVDAAQKDGVEVIMAIGGASADQVLDFKEDLSLDIKYGLADDILLKTIVRSNPGTVLMDKGTLLDKWHYKKLPSWKEVKAEFIAR